jgi:hypothetical protein
MNTQKRKILDYVEQFGSITAREAFIDLNINSPRKVISDLKKSGLYSVESIEERKTDEDGRTIKWRRYFIREMV